MVVVVVVVVVVELVDAVEVDVAVTSDVVSKHENFTHSFKSQSFSDKLYSDCTTVFRKNSYLDRSSLDKDIPLDSFLGRDSL